MAVVVVARAAVTHPGCWGKGCPRHGCWVWWWPLVALNVRRRRNCQQKLWTSSKKNPPDMLSVPCKTQEPQKGRTTQLSRPAEREPYKCEQEATKIVVIAEGTSGMVERSKELKWGHSRAKHSVGYADRDSRVCGWFEDTAEVDLDACQSGTGVCACIDKGSWWAGKTVTST